MYNRIFRGKGEREKRSVAGLAELHGTFWQEDLFLSLKKKDREVAGRGKRRKGDKGTGAPWN